MRITNAGFRHKTAALAALIVMGLLYGCAPVTSDQAPSPLASAPSAELTPDAGQVQVNGVTIAYESFGPDDRETILFISGTGQQLIDWPIELIDQLVQQGYRVIRYDNRDVGLSTHFDEAGLPDGEAVTQALQSGEPAPLPYTLSDMAQDAVALLDALDIDQAHIVGASMGGAIAQLVAIDHAQRVRSLTLLMSDSGNPALPVVAKPEVFESVPPVPSADDREAYVEYEVKTRLALSSPGHPTDEQTIREWVMRDVERAYDPEGLVRHQFVILVDRYENPPYRLTNLETIQAPTVVLHGADDPLVPIESAQELADLIPGAELRLIPGLGHDIPQALVPEFADAIMAAVSRADGAES